MYIAPDTDVCLLTGVPLEKTYENTLYFSSAAAQADYFLSRMKHSFTDQSYQRKDRGFLRLAIDANECYDCNYMMYKNSAFSDKWFYAFIDTVDYVSNEECIIRYTIDVMQTWFFDYTLQACFIDREHTETDDYFEHTVPETIGYGELICQETQFEDVSDFDVKGAILIASSDPAGQTPTPKTIYGMYTPFYVEVTSKLGIDTGAGWGKVRIALDQYVQSGKEDAVISVYPIPKFMCTEAIAPPEEPAVFEFSVTKNTAQLNGYVPRNKKLFCYPYNQLWLTNQSGTICAYRYEDFEKPESGLGSCEFRAVGVAVTTPSYTIIPEHYKGRDLYPDESVTISSFPPIPFVGDIYAAYMAMNRNTLAYAQFAPIERANFSAQLQTIGLVPSMLGSLASGNAVGAVGGLVSGGFNIGMTRMQGRFESQMAAQSQLARQQDLQNTPDAVHGLVAASSTMYAADLMRPVFLKMCVKPEYAAIIDDYFDRYGYKCNRNKVPNRNVRPHWTYTKTVGCAINGNMPADDAAAVCAIYDRGITFWANPAEVGDYSLDNSV